MLIVDMKNTIIKTLYGLSSRLQITEDRISEVGDRSIGFIQSEQQRKKWSTRKNISSNPWDNNKRSNICIIRIAGEEQECKAEQLFKEIMTTNFPNLTKGKIYRFKQLDK